MADPFLSEIRNIKEKARRYNDKSNQPDTFVEDPLMQGFLTNLHGYNAGATDKIPKASDYAGGNTANEELMQAILDRLLNEKFYKPPQNAATTPTPIPDDGTYGGASGGSPWEKFKGLFR